MKKELNDLKERLKDFRENTLHLTTKEFAEKLNIQDINEEKIVWFEQGLACPDVRFFYALKDNLGYGSQTWVWLLTGRDS